MSGRYFVVYLGMAALILLSAFPAFAAEAPQGQQPASPSREQLEKTLQSAPDGKNEQTPNLYANLPQEYILEAQQFFSRCKSSGTMSPYYNCKCLATKYLDKRIELGPEASDNDISFAIEGECPDASEAAGYKYTQCLKQLGAIPPRTDPEEYCSCYANTFAKLYEQNRKGPSSKVFVRLQAQAMTICRNPDLAGKTDPNKVR